MASLGARSAAVATFRDARSSAEPQNPDEAMARANKLLGSSSTHVDGMEYEYLMSSELTTEPALLRLRSALDADASI